MNILYSGDGQGNWWRREWKPQCETKVFMADQCQGVKDHTGEHWCYGPSGSYYWESPDKNLKPTDIACGSTPPTHPSYISPVQKDKEYYLRFYSDTEVTDPKVLAKLSRGRTPEKDAGITQPLSKAEADKLSLEDD